MRAILAALVAVSMAIFPISMGPTAALAGVHHGVAAGAHHGAAAADAHHDDHADGDHRADASLACEAGSGVTGDAPPCHGDAGSDGQAGAYCCGGVACHFFQISAAPVLFAPPLNPSSLALSGDAQIAGVASGRIDRPPRTV